MNIPAKIKERKKLYVFTISPAFSVYLADDESYCFSGLPVFTWPPNPTGWSQWWGLTHILSRHMHICVYVHVYSMCTGIQVYCMYCICACLCVSVYACHHKEGGGLLYKHNVHFCMYITIQFNLPFHQPTVAP